VYKPFPGPSHLHLLFRPRRGSWATPETKTAGMTSVMRRYSSDFAFYWLQPSRERLGIGWRTRNVVDHDR